MDEVVHEGSEIVITKHRKPVSRFVLCREPPCPLFNAGRGRMKIVGDIIRPVDVEWQAEPHPDSVLNP